MKTGDLVLFRGRGFIAWAIRAWTRSPWAHAGVLWVVEGVPLVIEAGVAKHHAPEGIGLTEVLDEDRLRVDELEDQVSSSHQALGETAIDMGVDHPPEEDLV